MGALSWLDCDGHKTVHNHRRSPRMRPNLSTTSNIVVNISSASLPPAQQRHASPSGADDHSERGVDQRLRTGTELQIRWEERKGVQRQVRARAMGASKAGLLVQSERAIAAGTVVVLYTAGFVPIGRASVRECTTRGLDYSVTMYMPGRSTPDL